MADEQRSTTGAAEMKAAQALTTKVLAIGSWTSKATPETRPPIMPCEARDTLRLQLAGKIDQWFAKSDGSGAVFLMNVTDPAEAHALLEELPLGRDEMMTCELITMGPLWPLGPLPREPAKSPRRVGHRAVEPPAVPARPRQRLGRGRAPAGCRTRGPPRPGGGCRNNKSAALAGVGYPGP